MAKIDVTLALVVLGFCMLSTLPTVISINEEFILRFMNNLPYPINCRMGYNDNWEKNMEWKPLESVINGKYQTSYPSMNYTGKPINLFCFKDYDPTVKTGNFKKTQIIFGPNPQKHTYNDRYNVCIRYDKDWFYNWQDRCQERPEFFDQTKKWDYIPPPPTPPPPPPCHSCIPYKH